MLDSKEQLTGGGGGKGGSGGCPRGKSTLRKGASRSAIPSLFTIREEEEGKKQRGARRRRKKASSSQGTAEEGAASSTSRGISSVSGQTYTVTLSTAGSSSSPQGSTAYRADSLLYNKIDERQKLARERRELQEKQNALREAEWQEREERARQQYEKHLEERRRRQEEQRYKEDKRRIAVEEKRRKKLEEDQARHEAVIRRTSERSQRTRPKPNRWSWGGALPTHTPSTHAGFVESAFLYQLDLAGLEHLQGAYSQSRRYGMASQYSDRRAVSTMNLSKHMDPIITKRLSHSSATLMHSPDRGLRHMPLSPWENMMVNRLQQPTHSYLARSRSTASLAKELTALPVCPRSVSCQPTGPMSFRALQAQPLPHCRSHDRNLSRGTPPCPPFCKRNLGAMQHKEGDFTRKSWSNLTLPLAPTLSVAPRKRSSSPGKKKSKATSPSPVRPPQKPIGRPLTPKLIKSPVADDPGNMRPVKLTPEITVAPPPTSAGGGKGGAEEAEGGNRLLSPPQPRPQPVGQNRSSPEQAPTAPPPVTSSPEAAAAGSPAAPRASAGTTDREEASRILAENRRLAREQREREEGQRREQEEQQRLATEEMTRRKAEERARREEEEQKQAEERKLKEEEEERLGEKERLQKEKEEAEKLQRQRVEEEARQKEEGERLKQERDKHFQKEEAERNERKKRLEEIMKRTRRSDPSEKKVTPRSNGGDAAVSPSQETAPSAQHQNGNGHAAPNSTPAPPPDTSISTPPDGRENGEFEEVITLPPGSRQRPPGEEQQQPPEERDRVIAFRENGLLKPLGGRDDLTAKQETDVA
ncbi:ensconsin isoform X2 [Gadus macrocephalus]|uniref:ensconsin isoform X2 n=1 Tax=Gadus macrocephalus TaxID=80720 RepID=UPI0028CBA524|nr:ensconsin isoform X2 [Gadus macrocephalus]